MQYLFNKKLLSIVYFSCALSFLFHKDVAAGTLPISMMESEVPATTENYLIVLSPLANTTIKSHVHAPVLKIHKKLGERFEKGELLIELDPHLFLAEKNKAQAILEKNDAQLKAKQQLYKEQIASLSELKEAEAELAISQRDLIFAQDALNGCKIFAPYAGCVKNVEVEEYEEVQAGETLIHIVDDSVLIAKMLLPSNCIKQIKLGGILPISVKENKTTVNATITHIDALIDPSSRMFRVYAQMNNHDLQLKGGMRGKILLNLANP